MNPKMRPYAPALLLTLTLCMGCYEDEDQGINKVPLYDATMSILNRTNELQLVTVTLLTPDLVVDCTNARRHPAWYLNDSFDVLTSTTFALASGQEIPVHPRQRADISNYYYYNVLPPLDTRNCYGVKIEAPGFDTIVAFWTPDQSTKSFYLDANVPKDIPSDIYTIEMNADYNNATASEMNPWRHKVCDQLYASQCSEEERQLASTKPSGAQYSWGQSNGPRLFESTQTRPLTRPAMCQINKQFFIQSSGSSNQERILDVERTDNTPGYHPCYAITTQNRSIRYCVPDTIGALFRPIEPAQNVELSIQRGTNSSVKLFLDHKQDDNIVDTYNVFLSIRGEHNSSFGIQSKLLDSCGAIPLQCDETQSQTLAAMQLIVQNGNTTYDLAPGQWTELPNNTSVYINNAFTSVARDPSCEVSNLMETAIVVQF